jgi:diguanylate cyclase (GGDEF)-like protein
VTQQPEGGVDTEIAVSPRGGKARVQLLTLVLAVPSVLLLVFVVAPLPAVPNPRLMPWWVLAPLFALAEASVVHIQFRREAHSFSLGELPLILGLFFATPLTVVLANVGGTAAALIVHRRQSPLKLLFNLSNFALGSCVATTMFSHLVDVHDPLANRSLLAALVAVLAAGVIQSLGILIAISLSEGRLDASGVATTFGFALAATVVNSCMALIGVRLIWFDPSEAWLLIVPIMGVLIAYRFYVSEREKRGQVVFLYESSRQLQHAEAIDEAVASLLSQARELFRAEVAEIVFFPTRDKGATFRTSVGRQGKVEMLSPLILNDEEQRLIAKCVDDSPVILDGRRGDRQRNAFLRRWGLRDAMAVALRGEDRVLGLLLIGDRLGDVTAFDDEDLRLLEMLANQTGAILERGRLQQSLTQLTTLQEQLQRQASHDPLTGMGNRMLFQSSVEWALAQAGQELAVLLIDLDDFKTVNDSLGHPAGDELLRGVAERIAHCMRPADVAARLGGDEFAVLLTGDDAQTAERVAQRIIATLREPFDLAAEEVIIRASIGIVTSSSHERNTEELLRDADVAMYTAKSLGKGRWRHFEPAMHAAVQLRHRLKADLHRAVQRGEFELDYQPVVDIETGSVVAAEALLRWRHPQRGIVAPLEFLPFAEETGLIIPIGHWVLAAACSEAHSWPRSSSGEPIAIAVNVAARQLQQRDFVAEVCDVLDSTGLDARALILEVTETDIVDDPESIIECLTDLRRLHVRTAIDDFGTGQSSLSRLRDFPIDVLKIDKSFTTALSGAEESISFARAVFSFGVGLGLRVIAEGVETANHLPGLRQLNCEWAQGFYFSRPIAPVAMRALLARARQLPESASTLTGLSGAEFEPAQSLAGAGTKTD